MCGQCGIYTGFVSNSEMSFFQKLLLLNQDRGIHSTGVVAVTRRREETTKGKKRTIPSQLLMWKEARSAYDFLNFDDLDKKNKKESIFKGATKQLVFGHCRHATVGKINMQNAHPFAIGDIVGVHNGTIKIAFEGHKDYETDSEAFFALINKVGIKDALQEVESWTSTAYAIVYVNRKDSTLNIVRNADRPLKMAYNKNRNLLAWSSEGVDLLYAAAKKGIEIQYADIFEPKPYHHYKYDLNDPSGYLSPDITDLTPKKSQRTYTYQNTTAVAGTNGSGGGTSTYQYQSGKPQFSDSYTDFHYWSQGSTQFRTHKQSRAVYKWDSKQWTFVGLDSGGKVEPVLRTADEPDRFKDPPSFLTKPASTKKTPVPFEGGKQVIFQGFQGQQYMLRDFEKLMTNGCALCQKQPEVTEGLDLRIGWSDRDTFFCEECTAEDLVSQHMIVFRNTESTSTEDLTPSEDV